MEDGESVVNNEIVAESEQPNETVVADVIQKESVSSSLERLEPILPSLPIAEAPTNTSSSPSPFSTEEGFWAEAQHESNTISQVETTEVSFTPTVQTTDIPVLLTPAFVENMPANMAQQDLFADELIALPPRHPKSPAKITTTQKVNDFYGKKVEPIKQVVPESERVPQPEVQEVIVIYVVAGRQDFQGEELLRHILSYGLRYGDMSIFHRHEHPTGRGQVYFSMARAVEPGTFDLNTLSNETVSGVTFFMSLPGENSIVAYDLMVDTARRLANDLQGEVLNDQQQSFTRQLAEHYRERIQEFERRRLMKK
jgi:cell division protein ZipA